MTYYDFELAKHYVDFEMTIEAKPGDPVAVSVMPDGTKLIASQEVSKQPRLVLKDGKVTWENCRQNKPEGL